MQLPEHHYAVAILAAVLTGVAQLLLKLGAGSRRSGLRLWLNARAMAGYAMLLAVTLMNLYAFKVVPLRANVILSPLALFVVTVLSASILGERLSRTHLIGCALIAAGMAAFYL